MAFHVLVYAHMRLTVLVIENACTELVDLANIENEGTLPSLPVVIQLIKICGLPVERYFNPELMREESAERQRVSHKLQLCPEEYLPIVEGAIDGALRIHEQEKEPACV